MSGRRNPFEEIERVFERMSRELEDVAGELGRGERGPLGGGSDVAVDLVDEGDVYVVTMDVPGYEQDEIDLRVADGTLWVDCERSDATEEDEEDYLRRERRRASVRRSIGLPGPVEADDVSAKLRNGILTVRLPKVESGAGSDRIEIEGE